jgi:membrane-associated phospholipid phosphatase
MIIGDQTSTLPCSWRKLIWMSAISWVFVAAASTIDRPIAQAVHNSTIHHWMHTPLATAVKSLGVFYWSTIPAALAVALFHRFKLKAALFVLLTGLICLLGNLLKWLVGRIRPFRFVAHPDQALPFSLDPFHDGWEGLMTQKDLAFPSGHTMVAFATATALAILWPRWRWLFYFLAALVAAERVLENSHWLSDTVGAAGLAICGVNLMWKIMLPWVSATPVAKNEPLPATNLSQS